MAETFVNKNIQYRMGFSWWKFISFVWWPVWEGKLIAVTSPQADIFAEDDPETSIYTGNMSGGNGSSAARLFVTASSAFTGPNLPKSRADYHVVFTGSAVDPDTSTPITLLQRQQFGIYESVPQIMVTDADLQEDLRDANEYLDTRTNFVPVIMEGWNQLLLKLSREKRPDGTYLDPYEIADSTELYLAHKLLCMTMLCRELLTADAGRFGVLHQAYKDDFEAEYASLIGHQLEKWGTDSAIGTEADVSSTIKSHTTDIAWSDKNDAISNLKIQPQFGRDTAF